MTGPAQRLASSFTWLWLLLGVANCSALANPDANATAADADALDMSLEDLLDVQVTSVSKRPQSLSNAAAAVYVITNEDLRRSGVTNIPDALRMVPGIDVARIDANKWAVTARGFNGRFANKLLVLMDGRTIYSPTFSGVYWESQDVVLEDVERIEVIRGPGATVWGANAVNGVINIITRHAADTQGGLAVVGAGTEEQAFATARYGARLGEGTYGRVFAKFFQRDEFVYPDGLDAGDDWSGLRAGFRVDTQATARDNVTVQGEIHHEDINQTVSNSTLTPPFAQISDDNTDVFAGHLVGRWDHAQSATSHWTFQAYYDHFDRDETLLHERRNTVDLDLTHNVKIGDTHDLVWGLGYRYTRDDFRDSSTVRIEPDSRSDQLFGAFVQDQITLLPQQLWLILGSKFEHNDYSGFEVQPSARLSWSINQTNKVWASVSRAVRTPSRAEHDFRIRTLVIPPFNTVNPSPFPVETVATGDPAFGSESLITYEIGYRAAPSPNLTLDIATFYNEYDDLRKFDYSEPKLLTSPTRVTVPVLFDNGVSGNTYGAELAAAWQASDWMRFDLAYTYTESDIDWGIPGDIAQNTAAPRHKLSLRSSMDLTPNVDLDVWFRYTDRIEVFNAAEPESTITVDDYPSLDVRLAWRPREKVELSLVGQNLFDSSHLEYVQESFILPTEVERGVYGQLRLDF